MESLFLTRDQALSLWSGSADSKTLDYQRTNPRGYQIVRIHTKETTGIQDLAYNTTTSSTLCRMPYLNKKQNKTQTQSSPDRITTSFSLAHQRKNKQTKTQHKSYPIRSSHISLDQPQEDRNQKEERIQPFSRKEFNIP